jgi:hypothetical protein
MREDERKLCERQQELLREKNEVDDKAAQLKLRIRNAKIQYHDTGRGVQPDLLRRWEADAVKLQRKSQTLQGDLGSVGRQFKILQAERTSMAELFMQVAVERLDERLYQEIYDEAHSRRPF